MTLQADQALKDVPYDYCPYAASTVAVPEGQIQMAQGTVMNMRIQPLWVPCIGPQCQLWSVRRECCSKRDHEPELEPSEAESAAMQALQYAINHMIDRLAERVNALELELRTKGPKP